MTSSQQSLRVILILEFLALEMGQVGCAETSLSNYYCTLRNAPEDRISYLLRGVSLKSCNNYENYSIIRCNSV